MAKGFTQILGIDYKETFSPIVKAFSIRLILALATMHQCPMHQLDVANAFLHGHLDEDLYMAQPQGFVDSATPSYVCKLNWSIYGFKHAL